MRHCVPYAPGQICVSQDSATYNLTADTPGSYTVDGSEFQLHQDPAGCGPLWNATTNLIDLPSRNGGHLSM